MRSTGFKALATIVFNAVIVLASLLTPHAGAAPQFESSFTSLDAWDTLDFKGDADIHLGTDSTAPPGYSKEVLFCKGDHVVALAKSLRVTDGTLLLLYKECNPRDSDADGILVFDAQYGDDVSVEHNTKIVRPMIWLEQDNDTGLHLRARVGDEKEVVYVEKSGVGLVTDAWNKTNWIWQKVRLQGSLVEGKYWPAQEKEPEEWTLQATLPERTPGRVGFRIGSGNIAVAYFAYDPGDLSPTAPAFYMTPQSEQATLGQPIPVRLFNTVQFSPGSYRFALERGAEIVGETKVSADAFAGQSAHEIVIVPPESDASHDGIITVQGAMSKEGTRLALYGPAGAEIAMCALTCVDHGAILDQISSLQAKLPENTRADTTVIDLKKMYQDIARADLDLATGCLEEGKPEDAERALRYAGEALQAAGKSADAPVERKRLWRKNTMIQTGEGSRVAICGNLGGEANDIEFKFYGGEKLLGAGTGAQLASGILVEPFFGTYEVASDYSGECPKQLLATVMEVKDGQIFLNGEPFLVKGVNVHSLDAGNPERSRAMVKKLKRLGFNMLRGDHPPLWEVEMAYEENMAWSVLAPFSCDSTDEIFDKAGDARMAFVWDKTQEFIEAYREMPGALLWNSCNEITNETTEFLVSIYPMYKHLDPYCRPVHYANLYGQDRWQGQDVMAVNYYFAPGQTPEDRQPLIQRSIAIAKEHQLPIIYTEYNSYYGPVPETGVQAIYGLFAWGIENGMSGGFMYDKWMGEHHPGVFDQNLNVDPGMEAAFIDTFADARMEFEKRSEEGVSVKIVNKRPFTLRGFTISCDANGSELALPDLGPMETATITLPATEKSIAGHMRFTTHYGFGCDVPFEITIP